MSIVVMPKLVKAADGWVERSPHGDGKLLR